MFVRDVEVYSLSSLERVFGALEPTISYSNIITSVYLDVISEQLHLVLEN